jgi:4-amino-4-deoxy-L-arabinose transferase-like glycosyltransferase
MTAALTAAHLVAVFASPLDLYPDEAQYWLWSRTLDWGYYSKPPVVAWVIWATTAIGGDGEAWVRLAPSLFHAGAALAIFAAGRRLYGPAAALAGAALYALMPAIQLSSMVVTTDAAMLFFLALSLAAYVELPHAEGKGRLALAAAVGATLGLAFLSKYAAIYGVIGLALHLAISREARAAWSWPAAGAAVLAFAVLMGPNVAWNFAHGFETVHHTAANAAWGGRKLFNFPELGAFIVSQFGVFGPIPFAVLIGGTAWLAWTRKLSPADKLLLCFALPPLAIVTFQSFISRANANWSGAGYVAGALLVAAWLTRWRAKGWLGAAIAVQALFAGLFLACVINPHVADRIGQGNAFKRAKGWDQMTQQLVDRARREPGLTAVAVDDRFMFNSAAYYGRAYFLTPGHPPLRMWVREAHPQNQAETTDPLTVAQGARVLLANLEPAFRPDIVGDFATVEGQEIVSVRLDPKRSRRMELMIGRGFSPAPRDPVTGHPIRP